MTEWAPAIETIVVGVGLGWAVLLALAAIGHLARRQGVLGQ